VFDESSVPDESDVPDEAVCSIVGRRCATLRTGVGKFRQRVGQVIGVSDNKYPGQDT
jgi:hypothetical protein